MIQIQNLSKIYKLYTHPKDRMKEALHPFRKKYHTDFYALKDINFQIKKGETIGVIGKNGAGKSTLLKILTGVLSASKGSYQVNGKTASLLELGAGFNPEMTGKENVYFNGSILGYTKKEMTQKLQLILDFADIGAFIHQPVKTYSSGMSVRLAFAVAINVDPEVLIIDEALSVGDLRFQLKCFRKLEAIKKKGTTILLVTHDLGAVMNYCDRAIWLHNGFVKEQGEPELVCKYYMSFMAYGNETKKKNSLFLKRDVQKKDELISNDNQNIPWKSVSNCESFGNGDAEIIQVGFYESKKMESLEVLEGGEMVCLSLKIKVKKTIESPIVGFYFTDPQGNNILGTNTFFQQNQPNQFEKNTEKIIRFSFQFPKIHNDEYHLTVAVANGTQKNHTQNHWIHDVFPIKVRGKRLDFQGGSRLILESINIDLK